MDKDSPQMKSVKYLFGQIAPVHIECDTEEISPGPATCADSEEANQENHHAEVDSDSRD